jgi:hypothetical protein
MKNLVIFHESYIKFHLEKISIDRNSTADIISSYSTNYASGQFLVLTFGGIINIFPTIDGFSHQNSKIISLSTSIGELQGSTEDHSWFHITQVQETGTVVCISHVGNIVSIQGLEYYHSQSPSSSHKHEIVELEGTIEGGIYAAQWNPDCSKLILVTKNDSILCMTSSFDVIEEFTVHSISPSSPVSITWSPDSTIFTLCYEQTSEVGNVNGACVYIYSADDFKLKYTGRNVTVTGSGPAMIGSAVTDGSVLKGLTGVTSFSSNGVYIAVPQRKSSKKYQITLLEKNGFSHGGFDLQVSGSLS